ncbi:MAG: GNAT family N-acetyltransferase [Polyangiaceae bacterium]
MLYTKVKTSEVAQVSLLESFGFRVVDTNVTFEKQTGGERRPARATARVARPEDAEAVERIAATSFSFTRFHLDPQVEQAHANQIKGQWAANFFKGKRGDAMVVAELDGRVVGFNQLLHTPDAQVIDLIAVDADARRAGAAGAMMSVGESLYSGDRIRVGTQVANIPSMRLYEAMGFRVIASQYVLHAHWIAE